MKIFRLWVALTFWVLGMIALLDGATLKNKGEAALGAVVSIVACVGMKMQVDKILRR